jgi:hypothetical protein
MTSQDRSAMDIKYTYHDHGTADFETEKIAQIIIDLKPEDDPCDGITELLAKGWLEAFLRAYPRPDDLGKPADAAEALNLLTGVARLHNRCAERLDEMMLAARDQWGHGWGTIATAVNLPRSTVKGRIQVASERRTQTTQELARDRDGQEPRRDADDSPAQTTERQEARYARQAELRKLTKTRLIARYKRGITTPDGRTVRYLSSAYPIEQWSKDDVISSILDAEYPQGNEDA